ncbi:mixed lineage kinase domain-like protein [Strongylocentrotus purpuratus]|uniref:Protein kinase domain-containing protein n=1 Tax=Strongylocentrotus purpuratus TaxID=7668 RepID=A0A7M7GMX8_STRPU|nr:mixed lineage kinase domain-like protein [Strongylocentrotus purpuratus]|eukprot:XP_003730833.1 PREDICTED: mixed lineage kinase domain-like protein [Strongylocentrotus purpuratus]
MSVFDIFSGIGSLANIAVRIYGAVKEVKSFKSQSKTIANRVEFILLPVRALQKEVDAKHVVLPDLERERAGSGPDGDGYDYQDQEGPMMYIRPLLKLKDCMESVESFLIKLGDTKWVDKFMHKKKIQANFDNYNDQLTTLQRSLGFCLQVAFPKIVSEEMKKQLRDAFDKDTMGKQNKEDLELDLESIKEDLEKLKQDGDNQSQDIQDIKESLNLIYETGKKEFEHLHQEIQFKEQLRSTEEKYASELRMDYREFTDLETLQQGTYGPIIKTKHRFEDKLLVRKAFEDKELSSTRELKEQLNLWKNLQYSAFIVQLYGYTMDYESRMCFVVEYMSHGTLRSVLQDKENHPLPWEQRVTLARDCAQGLYTIHFCQKKTMLHRAITSTRFLVDERYRAKISDNGFVKSASKISKSKSTMLSGGRGSVEQDEINYLCPEETSMSFKRSIKSEVYKFGVILYEIASRMQPFQAMEQQDGTPLDHMKKYNFIKDGKTEDPPSDTPEAFKDLISLCRQRAPGKRPATDAVVAHLNKMC